MNSKELGNFLQNIHPGKDMRAGRKEITEKYDLEKCYEEDINAEAATQIDHVVKIRKMLLNRKQADD